MRPDGMWVGRADMWLLIKAEREGVVVLDGWYDVDEDLMGRD
jgi:hypothetical protein